MTRVEEACYKAAALVLGCHLALISVQASVRLHTSWGGEALIDLELLLPFRYSLPLAILVTLPLFVFCRAKQYWLYHLRIHGTQQAPVYSSDFLGRDWIRNTQAALKEHRFLDLLSEYFDHAGSTHWVQVFHTWVLNTKDYEVFKAMYGTQDDDWDIGGARQKATAAILGKTSIFSINGAEWKAARNMIRPAFVRNQIADLECTDRHVENFLRRLPRDGTTKIDIQDLLYMFTMDISTDFM